MKTGTKIKGTLIAELSKFKNCADLETAISVLRTELKAKIHNTGIELYSFEEERFLDWDSQGKGENQIRQGFIVILSKPITKNNIYQVINSVRAQPLTFF